MVMMMAMTMTVRDAAATDDDEDDDNDDYDDDVDNDKMMIHVTFRFRFSTRIFYRGVPGFATDYPCGVWCRGLTTCLRYVGPFFGNLVWNDSGFVGLT